MKNKLFVSALVIALCLPMLSFAKGASMGGRSSFSSSRSSFSSTRSVSTPRTSTRVSTPTKVNTPKVSTPKVSIRPSSTTAKVTSKPKTVNGKTYSKTGSVVSSTYQPKFKNGYVAPVGSVVYYRESSMMDWLPFYLIMTSQSHREAVVTEPAKDGQPAKETIVKEEGVDTMYVINWIISIFLVGGLIAFIVYKVNNKTKKYDQNSY